MSGLPDGTGQVLILEDLPAVRAGLRRVVEQALPRWEILEADSLSAAREQVRSATALRVVLVDLGLSDGSGIELIEALSAEQPRVELIVTTIFDDDTHLFGAMAAGATGYLLKEQPPEALVAHLRALEEGVPALSPSMARRMLRFFHDRGAPTIVPEVPKVHLAPREEEVLSLIGRGLRVPEVANALGIAESTVAGYVKELYRKLNICSRAEAALEAARRGLL